MQYPIYTPVSQPGTPAGPEFHRVTGQSGSAAPKWGIEEQIRAMCGYAETTNSSTTWNSLANTQHDWGSSTWPVAGNIRGRDWWCVANLHYFVCNTAPTGPDFHKLDETGTDERIGHPDSYYQITGEPIIPTSYDGLSNGKLFLSYWIPGGLARSSVAATYEHPRVVFGIKGMPANTTSQAIQWTREDALNWVVRNAHQNDLAGRTSNLASSLTSVADDTRANPLQKRISCSANDTFTFSVMVRKVDAQDHGEDYNQTVSLGGNQTSEVLEAGHSNNVVRAAAWFYSAAGEFIGKSVGPWTDPFDETTAITPGRGTWSNATTGGSGVTRYGWVEVNFTGTGYSVPMAPALPGLPIIQTSAKVIERERPVFGFAEVPENANPNAQEVNYVNVGVEFSYASRYSETLGDASKGAHYLIANPTCTRAVGKLDVDEISAGSITVGNFKERYGVGTSGKIIIDGENARIVIAD